MKYLLQKLLFQLHTSIMIFIYIIAAIVKNIIIIIVIIIIINIINIKVILSNN